MDYKLKFHTYSLNGVVTDISYKEHLGIGAAQTLSFRYFNKSMFVWCDVNLEVPLHCINIWQLACNFVEKLSYEEPKKKSRTRKGGDAIPL